MLRARLHSENQEKLWAAELAALRTVATLAGVHVAVEGDVLELATAAEEKKDWLDAAFCSAFARVPDGRVEPFGACNEGEAGE